METLNNTPVAFGNPSGIIGAGRIGQVHLDTLASVPGVKPVIISDVVEPVLKMVTEKYSVPKYTLDVSGIKIHFRVGLMDGWMDVILPFLVSVCLSLRGLAIPRAVKEPVLGLLNRGHRSRCNLIGRGMIIVLL